MGTSVSSRQMWGPPGSSRSPERPIATGACWADSKQASTSQDPTLPCPGECAQGDLCLPAPLDQRPTYGEEQRREALASTPPRDRALPEAHLKYL